jgi:hypothetical protein
LKSRWCPRTPRRKIMRRIREAVLDVARAIGTTAGCRQSRRNRRKVEALFPHMKRILRVGRLRLPGRSGRATTSCSPPPLKEAPVPT